MLHYFVQLNYAAVMLLVCLLIFVNTSHICGKRVARMFTWAILMVFALVVVDSIEYWCATLDHPTQLRILMSAIGYSLRPAIIFLLISFVWNKKRKWLYWWAVPLVLNTFIAFSAFFTGVAYSYDDTNAFVRGPLGYFAFVTSGLYLVVMMVVATRLYKSGGKLESLITVVATVLTTLSVGLESVAGYDGLINLSGSVLLVFYYIYLVAQQFKRDALTGALNSRSFYSDAEIRAKDITAVISFDLNNLKKINDSQGHAQGDIAIRAVTQAIDAALGNGCYLYRTGGDEFTVLCFDCTEQKVTETVAQIEKNIEETTYTCAVGVAFYHAGDSFGQICRLADQAMYENKRMLKKTPER
ncbi:MAG: GGDEF domain-containing protein [Roseburia sp.]